MDLGKFMLGESWAKTKAQTSEMQLGHWTSFHRAQDTGLDSAQVVQQLSAGLSKSLNASQVLWLSVEWQQKT